MILDLTWTDEEIVNNGLDHYDIIGINIGNFRECVIEYGIETLKKKYEDFLIESLVITVCEEIPNIVGIDYLDKFNGCYIADGEDFIDQIKGYSSILFTPTIEFHKGKKINDYIGKIK